MPKWINTRGKPILSVGVCDRCSIKMPLVELMPDPNYPGLRVCKKDRDVLDPWRKAPRETENIAIRHPRPDVTIALDVNGNPVQP